ncbi:microsomal signal peptidase 25 kDa subunit-domain-containing protein [Naematelia encephala]|uniref:Signal peptidase complex subunit 2 n=1 Tax=Naematelia encephala TaxID=71784 RepID=A0A1Y2BBC6_9TREE|nr:microsomal signal peptidase 25 kDa subunit-domain-containing protein [Naematelia encephala]
MARPKAVPNGAHINTSLEPSPPPPSSSTSLASDPLPSVKINNANLAEIKSALDDAVTKHLLEQSFTQSNLHPTVHLTLGYSSVIIALGSVLYSLRVSFDDSKPVLWVAVVGYFTLQGVLWAWKRWVEKGEVFQGKRRRMVKRIETDHIQVISSTSLLPPPTSQLTFSPHTRPSSPSSAMSSPTTLSPSSSSSHIHANAHSKEVSSPKLTNINTNTNTSSGPTYLLQLVLSTTSNNGKSLIHKSRVVTGRCVGDFVDVEGGVEEGEVMRWLGGLLSEAGLAGAEEDGVKEQ